MMELVSQGEDDQEGNQEPAVMQADGDTGDSSELDLGAQLSASSGSDCHFRSKAKKKEIPPYGRNDNFFSIPSTKFYSTSVKRELPCTHRGTRQSRPSAGQLRSESTEEV